jgi:hypothetical protein
VVGRMGGILVNIKVMEGILVISEKMEGSSVNCRIKKVANTDKD